MFFHNQLLINLLWSYDFKIIPLFSNVHTFAMTRILALICAIFWVFSGAQAQSNVLREYCPNHKPGLPNRESAHAYVDSASGKLYLTYMSKKKMYLNVYKDFKKLDGLDLDRTEDPGLFNQVFASILKEETNYYMLFANPTAAIFSVAKVNFDAKTIEPKETILKIKDSELYLHAFSEGNVFYVLTIVKYSSGFRLYAYDIASQKLTEHLLRFPNLKLDSYSSNSTLWSYYSDLTLWDMMTEQSGGTPFSTTNPYGYVRNPNSKSKLEPKIISGTTKFFQQKNEFFLLVEVLGEYTLAMNVNLLSFTASSEKIPHEQLQVGTLNGRSNSYLFEDKLIQVNVSKKDMVVRVLSLKTKEVLCRLAVNAEDTAISFANTPVSLSSKDNFWGTEKEKEVSKVKQILRQFAKNNVFVGAFRNKQGYLELYLGAYFVLSGGGYYGTNGAGGMTHHGGNSSTLLYSFASLVDETTWKHVDGVTTPNYFQELYTKQREIDCPQNAQTIFELGDKLYLGYYAKSPSKKDPMLEDIHYNVAEFGH
jgi:hypothetical protein